MKEKMQELWKEALKLSELPGTDESFFDLGGNSFLATQICQDFEQETGVTIDVMLIYDYDTIDDLIDFIQK